MKRQSLVLLAAAIVVAGTAGCFKDPVSSLRSGPALLAVDHQSVILKTGDSVAVVATVKDGQGNVLPATGATWASTDAAVARATLDTAVVPGNYFSRGFITGITAAGGQTTVIVTVGSVADTIRVTVLPITLSASMVAYAGTAKADTVAYPAPAAAKAYSAPDTLVLNASSTISFDSANASVAVQSPTGVSKGFLIKRSAAQLKAVFTVPAVGKVVVRKVEQVTGNAATGTIALDSLVGDSIAVSRVRFTGTVAQAGDTTSVTFAAPYTFTSSTKVNVGSAAGSIIGNTAPTLSFLTLSAKTGAVTLYSAKLGSVTLDSVKTNASYTSTVATFPGTVTVAGDTLTVTAPANATFDTTTGSTSAVSVLDATNGTQAGVVFARSTTALQVLTPASTDTSTTYTGKVSVSHVLVGTGSLALATPVTYTNNAARFPGVVVVVGDTMTVTPSLNTTFDPKRSTVTIKSTAGVILSRTASSISVIALKAATGTVKVSNVVLGAAKMTLRTALSYGIAQAMFPGAITSPGKLLDTIRLYSTANTKFTDSSSVIIAGSSPANSGFDAFILQQTADSMWVIPLVGSDTSITVTNVAVNGAFVPHLTTSGKVVVNADNTGEARGNNTSATATTLNITGPGTYYVYAAANDSTTDATDYYKFTLAAASPEVDITLSFVGDGSGDGSNPGMDVVLCKNLLSGACTYQLDLMGGAASVTTQPESGSATSLTAGTYYVAVFTRPTTSGNVTYQLKIVVN